MNGANGKTWWQRSRVAVLVVGAMVLLLCGAVAGFFSMFKSSDAYTMALAAARADARVTERLGTPIEDGWFPTGNIRLNGGGSGSAGLSIPVSGPRAAGKLFVVARRTAGEWKLLRLVLEDSDGKRIELIESGAAAAVDSSGN